jgi:hypothetical protein
VEDIAGFFVAAVAFFDDDPLLLVFLFEAAAPPPEDGDALWIGLALASFEDNDTADEAPWVLAFSDFFDALPPLFGFFATIECGIGDDDDDALPAFDLALVTSLEGDDDACSVGSRRVGRLRFLCSVYPSWTAVLLTKS